ncbi:MAG: hypothetical protein ACTSWY_10710 [Promethearchaeota archaeon]
MKRNQLVRIIAEEQSKEITPSIHVFNYFIKNAIKNRNEEKLRHFSQKISSHFFKQFLNE